MRATFPPCSVTGAPKIQAMRAIAELEATGREAYTGALGNASPGGLEMSVTIRTFEAAEGWLWLDVGGAVVADSDPEQEVEECLAKARPLVRAAGSGIVGASPRRGALSPRRHREPVRSTLSALGVIETILVRDGRPGRLDLHLARLTTSLERLYGASLPAELRRRLIAAASRRRSGALRVTVLGNGSFELVTRPLPRRPSPVRLEPAVLPGGLGAHKWADRRLLEGLTTRAATPLLVDGDDSVLEAAWGNVWIVEGDRLLTPPADGRILSGVTRGSILRHGARGLQAGEAEITLERMAGADAVLVSSSLAGLVPASPIAPDVEG
jgi:para-aminobenzoate synthetase/4-amino-4-deoxychorismate lyase